MFRLKSSPMFLILVVLTFSGTISCTLACVCGKQQVPAEQVDGTLLKPGNFPWTVEIRSRFMFDNFNIDVVCSGTILSPNYVLSSSLCLESFRMGLNLQIYAGITNDSSVQPLFNLTNPATNVPRPFGIVRLPEPFKFNANIQPICIPSIEQFKEIEDVAEHVYVEWTASEDASYFSLSQNIYDTKGMKPTPFNLHVQGIEGADLQFGSPLMYTKNVRWYLRGISVWIFSNRFHSIYLEKLLKPLDTEIHLDDGFDFVAFSNELKSCNI